jgi:hypothetical protein
MSSHNYPTNSDSEAIGNLITSTSADEFQLPFLLQQQPLTHKENQRDQEFPRRTNKIVSIIGMLVHYGGMRS